jgi:PAS domain S-box-containing protein
VTGDGRRATQSARASFEVIAESIPHIVWLADAAGSTDYFNERGTAYTGLPRQANYGWQWVELVHPDDADRARVGWEHATRTATPFELSYRIRRRDGEHRWHGFRALPVRGPAGEVLRWIGTADDLSELEAVDNDRRVQRQIAQLQRMLEVIQPVEGERFGFVEPERRAARVERALRSTNEATPQSEVGSGDEDGRSPLERLAPRELAVARLLASGHTNAEAANLLGLSLRSIEASRSGIRQALGVRTRAEIVRFVRDGGSTEPHG